MPLALLPRALTELDAMIEAKGFRAHFPVEVLFVAADDSWMSPASDPDAAAAAAALLADAAEVTAPGLPPKRVQRPLPGVVAFVGVIAYRPYGRSPGHEEYFAAVRSACPPVRLRPRLLPLLLP